jgi:small subunit ribosomal protein S18
MARNSKVGKKASNRKPRPAEGKGRLRRGRPKVCRLCSEHAEWVDYKDVNLLTRFLNDRGRIKSRGATGTCAQHQRDVAVAIKTARELALLPYSVRTLSADSGDRRGGGRRGQDRSSPAVEGAGTQVGGAEANTADADAVDGETVDDVVESLETDLASDRQPPAETPTVSAIP